MASARWAGERFRNLQPVIPGLRDPNASMPTLAEFLCGGERRLPRGPLPSLNPLQAWARPPASGLRATWLGHSTVLIEIDGLRVLTDPIWGTRASPSRLAGPKRFQPVPVRLRAMPPVDLVIVSHDHYDHLDYPTIRELARRDLPFVTSLGVGAHLEAWGVRPVFRREGCSIPVVAYLQEYLGVESLLTGFSLPEDNAHSPNEKLHLPTWQKGIAALALFFSYLAE
jgi:hypothetical protein